MSAQVSFEKSQGISRVIYKIQDQTIIAYMLSKYCDSETDWQYLIILNTICRMLCLENCEDMCVYLTADKTIVPVVPKFLGPSILNVLRVGMNSIHTVLENNNFIKRRLYYDKITARACALKIAKNEIISYGKIIYANRSISRKKYIPDYSRIYIPSKLNIAHSHNDFIENII
jgi:hypothetical protein